MQLHVAGKIENVKHTWLLDTGSDVTCTLWILAQMLLVHTSSRLPGIDEWHLDPPQIGPSSANGTPLHCIGEIVTSIVIHQVSKHNVCLLAIQNLNVPVWIPPEVLVPLELIGFIRHLLLELPS